MIEIASATNLGLSNNSIALSKTNTDPVGIGRDGARVAVNIANGNLVMQREGELLAGRVVAAIKDAFTGQSDERKDEESTG